MIRQPISIADLRGLAQRRLPRAVFDFIDGGSQDERTARQNEAAMEDWSLVPRVGIDVSQRDTRATLLGKEAGLPLFLAPTGLAGFFWPQGEIAAARAAAKARIPFCLSTNSVASLEEVARAAPEGDLWFQLYPLRDKSLMNALIGRARDAGYRVLCLTVDLPLLARRERDLRSGFTMPLRMHPQTVFDLCRHPRWVFGAMRNPLAFGNFRTDGKQRPLAVLVKTKELGPLSSSPSAANGAMHTADSAKVSIYSIRKGRLLRPLCRTQCRDLEKGRALWTSEA